MDKIKNAFFGSEHEAKEGEAFDRDLQERLKAERIAAKEAAQKAKEKEAKKKRKEQKKIEKQKKKDAKKKAKATQKEAAQREKVWLFTDSYEIEVRDALRSVPFGLIFLTVSNFTPQARLHIICVIRQQALPCTILLSNCRHCKCLRPHFCGTCKTTNVSPRIVCHGKFERKEPRILLLRPTA